MQLLYIVQWGKEKSICWVYEQGNLKDGQFYIINNQQIANYDELGLVIN